MKSILTVAFVAISILSSCQQTPETKKFTTIKNDPKLDVKVVNEEDPICGMKTAQFLKDTVFIKEKPMVSAINFKRRIQKNPKNTQNNF